MWQIFLIQVEWFPIPRFPTSPLRYYISLFVSIILTFFSPYRGIHSEVWLFQRRADHISFFNLSHYWTEMPLFSHQRSVQKSVAYIPVLRNFFSNFSSESNCAVWKYNRGIMKHRWALNVHRLNNIITFPATYL